MLFRKGQVKKLNVVLDKTVYPGLGIWELVLLFDSRNIYLLICFLILGIFIALVLNFEYLNFQHGILYVHFKLII